MTKRVSLHPAFVLHTRSFRDTSLLIDALTMRYGRVSLIARGAKSAKSKFRGLVRPFVPLVISFTGKTDLYTLTQAEATAPAVQLQGKALLSAMYVNELIIKLLARDDPHQAVFIAYQNLLQDLQAKEFEAKLRYFEMQFLQALGYGFDLTKDAFSQPIAPERIYYFDPTRGILPVQLSYSQQIRFKGQHLLAFAKKNLQSKEELQTAKKLMRLAIAVHLRSALKTRSVYADLAKV